MTRAPGFALLLVAGWAAAAPGANSGTVAGQGVSPGDESTNSPIIECARLRPEQLRGLPALRKICPDIDAAAAALGLEPLLPPDWQSKVSAEGLSNLRVLAARYASAPPQAIPDPRQLRSLARALQAPQAPPAWWQRVGAWLSRWLDASAVHWPGWLWPRWASGPRFWSGVILVVASLLLVTAVVIVLREVSAVRLGGRRRPRSDSGVLHHAVLEEALPALEEIELASPQQRPILTLRLLVGALARSRRLVRERNLTCRELVTAATFDSASQREQFGQYALLAERALYGNGGVAQSGGPELDAIKTLYESLLVPSAATQSESA